MADRHSLKPAKAIALLAMATLISACTGRPVVPVSDLTSGRTQHTARIVRAGDSLYTIAWESGLDYRDVARWNQLEAPFALKIGQKIFLGGARPAGARSQTSSITALPKTQAVSGAKSARSAASENTTPVVAKAKPNTELSLSKNSLGSREWIWPAQGKLVGRFDGASGENGIDIAGVDGSPIRAASGGRVVYAGTGLRGYGLLLIVKHDDTYLSAYAHNRAVMVNEGDQIHSGQVIAEMGQSGSESVRLHFEIRKDGQPVDPLHFLPAGDG